jgi:hypothetical protein
MTVAEEGMPCGGPYVRCAVGTECRDGQCKAIDDLGIFARCLVDGGM